MNLVGFTIRSCEDEWASMKYLFSLTQILVGLFIGGGIVLLCIISPPTAKSLG